MKRCEGLCERLEEQNFCPVTLLPKSAQQFFDNLPRQLRPQSELLPAQAFNVGRVQIECAGDHNFAELFDAFVKLHEVRWRMNDMLGVLCDENMQSFHREAATGFRANGALRLYALRINRRIIAAFYGFHYAARTYYYLGGFDPEFKQYSPGNILIAHAITEAIREGAREFDFLRGQEDYKYRWPDRSDHLPQARNKVQVGPRSMENDSDSKSECLLPAIKQSRW